VLMSATYFSHEEPPQPCGNKHGKGHFSKFERPGLLALPDARGRNRLVPPIDLQSTQRCHPCCGVPFGASISVNQRTATSCHSVVHFPVWAGLKEDLPTYLAALLGVSNQFQDDTLRLPLACQRVLSQVTGLVSIDLTTVALDGAVVPIVGVS
jgi:hypothetical protein